MRTLKERISKNDILFYLYQLSKTKIMNKVKVIADANGSIITQNQNNPEYGYIRVEQGAVNLGRWANVENRVAFIQGTMENLSTAVSLMGLKANKELDGKIVIKEQFTPFYEGQARKTYGDSVSPVFKMVLKSIAKPITRQI